MLIKYIGHACFKVRDNETGYSIVFDPYSPGSIPGVGDVVDAASEVLCSHDHYDHNCRDAIKLEPQEESPFEVTAIDTYHDDKKGALRGKNRIYIITDKKTGEKLVHYGDIGEVMDDLLTEENMRLLVGADIALIPVGGTYTYDADQALELIRRTSPKITIPMHFRSRDAGFGLEKIGCIEDFIIKADKAGNKVYVGRTFFFDTDGGGESLDTSAGCILALRPQNIRG